MRKILHIVILLCLVIVSSSCWNGKRVGRMIVSPGNYKVFEAKLKHDLPEGTPLEFIRKYLNSLGLEHGFSEQERMVWARLCDIRCDFRIILPAIGEDRQSDFPIFTPINWLCAFKDQNQA